MKNSHGYFYILSLMVVVASALSACKTAKLSDADEALARGEYFNAQKIYRQVYNKKNKREDRPLRGEIAFKMGKCYTKLNMAAKSCRIFPQRHKI